MAGSNPDELTERLHREWATQDGFFYRLRRGN
jgi:hypothetical protein